MGRFHLYVWRQVEGLTTNWHDGGGLAVIATTLTSARALMRDHVTASCTALESEPDYTVATDAGEPAVFLFPNAGCC
jgi:hypothetical protein